jgi:protease-4
MNIGLLNILKTVSWDFRRDMAQNYANALKNAIELHIPNDKELHESFFLSKKGSKTARGGFEDKLYVGNIHRIENHLYWNDEELADDDQIVNVVVIDGPVTRDGGGCSYGTKDFRDQVEYANTIPQVVFHLFLVNTPGGETACRNDYDEMFRSCREAGKPTVWYVDGMCCSSGVNGGCRADRVIVRNPKDDFGCIGSMAAFWATPDGAIDRDGTRYIEIVGDESPDKNDWYREAAQGNYEKLREMINKDTEEFHQTVRENRPLVEDWMLTGKVFEAQELIPALVDEIGDFNRAIECGFELAEGRLQSAHDATVVKDPEEEPEGEQPEGKEPEESTHINENNMTDEEKKAAEVAEQPAATQEEAPATEQPAEEAPATEAPAVSEENAQEQAGAQAAAADNDMEGAPAEGAAPAGEAAGTEAPASQEAQEAAAAEIDKITDTLHNAEQMVADRDAEIARLKESLATLNGIAEERDQANATVAERDKTIETLTADKEAQAQKIQEAEAKIAEHVATIETLKKQVADMKAEVKELAGKPAPMTDGTAGIPQDNGTGEAPKAKQTWEQRVKRDMSYKEVLKTKNGE